MADQMEDKINGNPACSEATFLGILRCVSYDRLALLQGIYYFVTGIWPLIGMHSFLYFTGPKQDLWLVQTTGLLLMVIGLALIIAGRKRKESPDVLVLALGTAASLAAIEVIYVERKLISPVYLLDTIIELFIIALWIYVLTRERERTS